MAVAGVSRLAKWTVVWAAGAAAVLVLSPRLYAESLLDKALDTPPAPAAGSAVNANNALPQPAPISPVTYAAPSASSGTTASASAMTAQAPSASLSASAPVSAPKATLATATSPVAHPGKLRGEVSAVIHKLDPLRALHEHRFQIASAQFPAFCHDWQTKLEDRTRWNLSQINWHEDHGLESGTYTSYSPINSCTTKMSDSGVAIGKLSYDEYVYSLSGKTVEEAKHAQPKQVSVVRTLEIFRFDHDKWFE